MPKTIPVIYTSTSTPLPRLDRQTSTYGALTKTLIIIVQDDNRMNTSVIYICYTFLAFRFSFVLYNDLVFRLFDNSRIANLESRSTAGTISWD